MRCNNMIVSPKIWELGMLGTWLIIGTPLLNMIAEPQRHLLDLLLLVSQAFQLEVVWLMPALHH
jgi:hypothetical protein